MVVTKHLLICSVISEKNCSQSLYTLAVCSFASTYKARDSMGKGGGEWCTSMAEITGFPAITISENKYLPPAHGY